MWWLKLIGDNDSPMFPGVPIFEPPSQGGLGVEEDEVLFPKEKYPGKLVTGDWLVYYAVGGEKAIFAIAQVMGDVERDKYKNHPSPVRQHYCHAAPVDISRYERIDDLTHAPKLSTVTMRIDPVFGDLAQQSLLGLHQEEFDKARTVIRQAAGKFHP